MKVEDLVRGSLHLLGGGALRLLRKVSPEDAQELVEALAIGYGVMTRRQEIAPMMLEYGVASARHDELLGTTDQDETAELANLYRTMDRIQSVVSRGPGSEWEHLEKKALAAEKASQENKT